MLPREMWDLLLVGAVLAPMGWAVLLALPFGRALQMRLAPLAAFPALAAAVTGAMGLGWEPVVGSGVFSLGLDATGQVFLAFTAVLWLVAAWYSRGYLTEDKHPVRYYLFFLLSMGGNFLLILALDIPTFYAGFALMGFASAGLVLHKGDEEAVRAGRIYLGLAAVGEVVLFVAFGMLTGQTGSIVITEVVQSSMSPLVMWLLIVGFGIKAGSLTVHFWLPLAHPAAPVPASAVLSGAMIKAGLYGWLRFLPLGLVSYELLGKTLIVSGLLSALIATLAAVTQRNPKTVLAYSSLSQMGIISVGLGVTFMHPAAWPGVLAAILVYALHHGLSKGALFLAVTPALEARGAAQVWGARVGLLIPALALAGAPFTSGAVAKLAFKGELDYLAPPWPYIVGFLLTLAAMGTTLMMARFLVLVWPSRHSEPKELCHRVWLPWLFSVCTVVVGVWGLPGTIEKAGSFTSPEKLWAAAWPVVAGALLAWVTHYLFRRSNRPAPRGIPAGDMIVPFEKLASGVMRKVGAMQARRASQGASELAPARESPWPARLRSGEHLLRQFSTGFMALMAVVLVVLLVAHLT